MSGRRCLVVVVVGWMLTSAGCASEPSHAEVAATTCTALRATNNEIVALVNSSVAGIGSAAPDERLAPIVAGLDELRAALMVWDVEIDGLDLPDSDDGRLLTDQLHDGLDRAVAELDAQAAEFTRKTASIPDDEVAGVVGAWFNSVEKVVSSIEPEVFRFERRDFKQAFLDEPACRNVIQQFVND